MTLDELSAGPGTPLTSADLKAGAAVLGVSVAKIQTVDQVESRGRGIDAETRRPVILYEPHIFSRLTGGKFDETHPELSYPKPYMRDYPATQAQRYAMLAVAMGLDEAAALKATSWGRYQVMGFNYATAGFAGVLTFVAAMVRGEGEQLMAFCRFVMANPGMHQALKGGNWATFARLYNGPGFAAHGYDQRLKTTYARLLAQAA